MRTKLIVAALATAAAVCAVGASAYTESLGQTPATQIIGYGTTTINGGTMHAAPTFTYNAAHTTITAITVVLDGDTTSNTLYIDPNGAGPAACSAGTGTHTAGPPDITTYACTGLSISAAGLQSLAYSLI